MKNSQGNVFLAFIFFALFGAYLPNIYGMIPEKLTYDALAVNKRGMYDYDDDIKQPEEEERHQSNYFRWKNMNIKSDFGDSDRLLALDDGVKKSTGYKHKSYLKKTKYEPSYSRDDSNYIENDIDSDTDNDGDNDGDTYIDPDIDDYPYVGYKKEKEYKEEKEGRSQQINLKKRKQRMHKYKKMHKDELKEEDFDMKGNGEDDDQPL